MKKILTVIMFFFVCISCCACGEEAKNDLYDDFNRMTKAEYTDYRIEVCSVSDDNALNSTYKVKAENGMNKIEYTYEVLNPISDIDGEIVMPSEYKSVKSGTVTVKNGKIIEQNGEELNIEVARIDKIGLKFNETYFANITSETNCFKAQVKNVEGFTGKSISCAEMAVEIEYNENKFEQIVISYVSNTISTEIKYIF